MFSGLDSDLIRTVGVLAVIPVLLAIWASMRTSAKGSAGQAKVYEMLSTEVERLNRKVAEMGNTIDEMRVECAREIRERDDRILALEREVAELAGQIKERHYLDDLGRKGLIDRRKSQEVPNESEPAQ